MDVFYLRDRLVEDYREYVESFIRIKDERIRSTVEEAIDAGLLWPEAEWLADEEVERLLAAAPSGNIAPDQAQAALERILSDFDYVRAYLDHVAEARAAVLARSHERVRQAWTRATGKAATVAPELPADVLGLYVFLPGVMS